VAQIPRRIILSAKAETEYSGANPREQETDNVNPVNKMDGTRRLRRRVCARQAPIPRFVGPYGE